MVKNFSERFKYCITFPEKLFCIWRPDFTFLSFLPIFSHSEDSMQVASFQFHNVRVTVSVSCITKERLQIYSLMEKRKVNHTFTSGSGVALFDILRNKFINYL